MSCQPRSIEYNGGRRVFAETLASRTIAARRTISIRSVLHEGLAENMNCLFYPRSVAVIGASGRFGKWGFGIISAVLKGGGDYTVYPVNPRGGEILGVKALTNITEAPGRWTWP